MNIKTLGFSVLSILLFISNYAQNEFITTWQVSGSDLSIQIPADQFDFTYDYTVDFGDGTVLNNQTSSVSHTYASAGTYTVLISGTFPKFNGGALFDNGELMSVEQWGNIQWLSMEAAFEDCFNLTINATDNPDLSNVTNMSFMFASADLVNSPTISTWDVSNITNMKAAFGNADSFNQPLNNWDVSNATNMDNMFGGNDAFNQPLNDWNVSNVISMFGMFSNATAFNQDISNWDVSNVTDMGEMFKQSSFNQPLGSWNTSSVTNMREMFNDCPYNHPLNSWNVSNVINMQSMFEFSPYNQPLDNWDTSSVTNMDWMFYFSPFNHDINSWDVSAVVQMQSMFQSSDFNQPLGNWDVSNVEFMANMFESAVFNQPLNSWDVSNVTSMFDMFKFSSFNQPLNNWDVSSVDGSGFHTMFASSDFNQDLSSWDFSTGNLDDFIENSEMDAQNYDLLLDRFVQLDIQNGSLFANGLEYCDIFTREQLIQNQNWNIEDDELGGNCNVNYISGNVQFDENSDGCDSNDQALDQYVINTSDSQSDISTLTDENGMYTTTVNTGNFDVSVLDLPDYFDASPVVHNISFTSSNLTSTQNDFCITANQTIDDLSLELFPIGTAIPGFESEYELIIENNGTQTQNNVQVEFIFEDANQNFVTASQSANQNGNTLSFDISSINPFSSETISVTLINEQPPNLNSGDILTITANVTPDANDASLANNSVEFDQIVVNSFDPNDKLVTQGDEIKVDKKDEYLDYKIRFQNVGTANALNVKITDTISDKLDWTTFQPINSSHDYRLELIDQEEINFIFDNINLPNESIDEEGSNGHVSFKIKPKSDVQIGDIIENKAYIFFDFNAPIITNTVATEIMDNLSAIDFSNQDVSIFPNPADDFIRINNNSSHDIQKIDIFSANGKFVRSYNNNSILDISSLDSGVYIVKVETQFSEFSKKLIIR